MTAAVSPSSPVLPVVAASYEVVGHLDYSTVAHDSARVMIISSRKGAHVIATVDKTGKFSTMLPSDTYGLSIKSTSVGEQMGIVFAPETLDIKVKDKPITNLFFSPLPICDHAAPSSSVLQITPHDRIDLLVPCSVSDSSASSWGTPSLVTMKVTASNVSAPPPLDPLNIYIVDINNSPERYLKTVEQVVASRPPTGIVLLYNMEELVLAKLPDDQGQLCVVSASPLQDQG